MNERVLQFDCKGERLIGILHQPDERRAGAVGILVIVGGPQYRVGSHRQFVLMARSFAAHGFPVLRFDYRGMGDSTGEKRTFEQVSEDIKAGIDALLCADPALRSVVIFGLCDAASAALMYASSDVRVRGLLLANPWVRTQTGADRAIVRHYYGKRLLQKSFWTKIFTGKVNVTGAALELLSRWRSARAPGAAVPQDFVAQMLAGLTDFQGPILLLMSGRDLTAREFDDLCASASDWSSRLKDRGIQRHDVVDADHTFSSRRSLEDMCERSLSWLGKLS